MNKNKGSSRSLSDIFNLIFKSTSKRPSNESDRHITTNKELIEINSKPRTSNSRLYNENYPKPSSLLNIGANCYLNSALQSISSCEKFVKDIEKLHLQFKDLEKLSLFHKLISHLHNGSKSLVEISSHQIFRNWNKTGQQDSFELLAYVLNQVYDEIRKFKEENGDIPKRNIQAWLKEKLPMRIKLGYKIRCGCKRSIIIPVQSDLALHVTIPINHCDTDLQGLVNQFFEKDQVVDYMCESMTCSGMNATRFTKLIRPLPQTLCIHLQRSHWDGKKIYKITKRIVFTSHLIIRSKYCASINEKDGNINFDSLYQSISEDKSRNFGVVNYKTNVRIIPDNDKIYNFDGIINVRRSSDVSDSLKLSRSIRSLHKSEGDDKRDSRNSDNEDVLTKEKIDDDVFNLCSVIVHRGSVDGGHYVCYKCFKNLWYLTNDSQVIRVPSKDIYNSDAYILIYEHV